MHDITYIQLLTKEVIENGIAQRRMINGTKEWNNGEQLITMKTFTGYFDAALV